MKIRLLILLSFIFLSFLTYWVIGKITFLIGNDVEGAFTRMAYRISFMIRAIGIGIGCLAVLAVGGMIYFKKAFRKEYFKGFLLASVYMGVILLVYLYLIIFKS